ncbi:MAG TPA: serine hydrolase domain-containing protein, partial [Thermoflexales bacterium]|nr:serine hydrolase domain-containing protein [Thermoflexales bacterium]
MTSTPALDRLPGLDATVRAILRDWRVPGLALAVVADGEVLDARGYGYADLEQKRPVTPDTTFAIGSCTKAFTTTALAMLVERGALDWDRPVRDYLPGFRMLDEVAGAR